MAFDDETLRRIEGVESDERVAARLAALPDDQRDAVMARVLHERDYSDIAAELGCSESVVRQRVSRGLRGLRAQTERGQQ